MSKELKLGDKYILKHGAIDPLPMELVEITDTDYVFIDGGSPWGGPKHKVEELIEKGSLIKWEG